jgi:AraC-like DNA-binding protein
MGLDKTINTIPDVLKKVRSDFWVETFIFAESGPVFPGCIKSQALTMVLIQEGKQEIKLYRDGSLVEESLEPGRVLFVGAHCPWSLNWKHPCDRLGVSCYPHRVGISWNRHRQPVDHLDILPDLWLSSALSAESDLWHLVSALNARTDSPPDSALTLKIPKLILMALDLQLAQIGSGKTSRPLDTYSQICHYMENNFAQPLNRNLIANQFGLNPDYVTRLFNEKGNILFSDYLRNLRLEHAEELLKHSTLTVKEISAQCGFSESSYFIKVFRKRYQCSPNQYRKDWLRDRMV